MATSSYYRGIGFPFTKGPTSLPAAAVDAELVRQSLDQIILTGRFERVMRPGFGCDAMSFIFEPNDELMSELIRTEVTSAIGRFEPRVILQDVQVVRDVEKGQVLVTVNYILVATRTPDSTVVPLPLR